MYKLRVEICTEIMITAESVVYNVEFKQMKITMADFHQISCIWGSSDWSNTKNIMALNLFLKNNQFIPGTESIS